MSDVTELVAKALMFVVGAGLALMLSALTLLALALAASAVMANA